ncbi:UBP1-associated protein 2A-like [Solanum dulcamara]|uniref:UBP1-associated protein 2A-like n=1 Tax=Solanum dulcamara TaxID=45834 RepID=UPI0024869578|nr:UBP1-associated protein 2A-like [Solanum dulcamara]
MGTKRKSSSSSTLKPQPEEQKPQSSSSEEEEYEEDPEESEYEEKSESEQESDSDDEDESTKRENIQKILEPFSKDQIIQQFKTAASNDPSILSRVTALADNDPTHRKIFVHGLGYDATSEQLLDAFKPYGEIVECKLITDKVTGRAKGYGFVLFKTRVGAKRALKEPQKKIGNRTTSCQLAAMRSSGTSQDSGGRKIYVGNVGADVDSEKLRAFFAKFGEIEEGPSGIDSVSRKFKGFAIFVYKSVEGANKALEEPQKSFDGCQLFCKKFVENLNNASSSNANQGVQQNEMSYGFGVTPGIMSGASINGMPLLMGQNMGFGMNPLLAPGFNPSFGGIGAGYGINGVSPVVVGSYGTDLAFQGLGTYQGAQMWQPSFGGSAAMATITTPAKDSSGVGSAGVTYPSSLGR